MVPRASTWIFIEYIPVGSFWGRKLRKNINFAHMMQKAMVDAGSAST